MPHRAELTEPTCASLPLRATVRASVRRASSSPFRPTVAISAWPGPPCSFSRRGASARRPRTSNHCRTPPSVSGSSVAMLPGTIRPCASRIGFVRVEGPSKGEGTRKDRRTTATFPEGRHGHRARCVRSTRVVDLPGSGKLGAQAAGPATAMAQRGHRHNDPGHLAVLKLGRIRFR